MSIPNQRRLTGLMLIAGAVVMLAIAAAIYAELVPSFGARREMAAFALVIIGAIDVVIGFVYVTRS